MKSAILAIILSILSGILTLGANVAVATETENLGIRVLPARGRVVADGKVDDWDLSGGVFVCNNAETERDAFAVWFHLMYDADNLYVLSRWVDPTPLNNPGQVAGSYGFAGDCLQIRFIVGGVCSHWESWRDRAGKEKIGIVYGTKFNQGSAKAKEAGVRQGFKIDADGKGYAQELVIPWKVLTRGAAAPKAGGSFIVTVEPNFTVGAGGRHTIKGIFKEGVPPDRVFTFMGSNQWGPAKMEHKGNVDPQPVRLSDAREFPVRMKGGVPVIDWDGLIQAKEIKGFKTIDFTMPADGFVSMHLRDAEGVVVRQLLNCAFYTAGAKKVKWDGLTTGVWKVPGRPVSPGKYTVHGIWHKGIGLRLRGFACNGGSAPWDNGDKTNWGGDHGNPSDVAAAADKVYLGWTGAEAGRAMVACDLEGNVQWKNSRTSMSGSPLVAAGGGRAYGLHGNKIYALRSADGLYVEWSKDGSPDLSVREIFAGSSKKATTPYGLSVKNGKLYVSVNCEDGAVAVVDAKTRKLLSTRRVPGARRLCAVSDKLVYVVADGSTVVALDPTSGETRDVVAGLNGAVGVAVDKAGQIYVGVGAPDHQVKVFNSDGKSVGAIGRKGGRAATGPWVADAFLHIRGIAVDAQGKLWVAEGGATPKRFTVWNAKTGKLLKELFGPTHYGASGAAILPSDPDIVAGEGCEWKIDPKTGRGSCTGVYENRHAGAAKFCRGANGKMYLATGGGMNSPTLYNIFERLGEGRYKKRASIRGGRGENANTAFWADRNDDGVEQADETQVLPGTTSAAGAYSFSMGFNTDLTFYAKNRGKNIQVRVKGFSACGAPLYDLDNIAQTPVWGSASPDNAMLLSGFPVNDMLEAYDLKTGKLRWKYPSPFFGVHGSHKAPPPEVGLIRGAFSPMGSVRLPDPVGVLWILNSNVGEWHVLTGEGFYLTGLFQSDPMKISWPPDALPGAILDNCPPGLGGEDFGGSIARTDDGKLRVQAGKTGIWTVDVTGLDNVKRLPRVNAVAIGAADLPKARAMRESYLQQAVGTKRIEIVRGTPAFTGNLTKDFKGAKTISYKRGSAAATTVAAWDDKNLYLAWDVQDRTPWVNAAKLPEEMYVSGDTVDFQLATDPDAKKNRDKAVAGDLRLSIGNFAGRPTAVLYRKVSAVKSPKIFSSGVVKEYPMDYVGVVEFSDIKHVERKGSGYVIEVAIPLAALGFKPAGGLKLRGDFGVTHGGPDGQRTRLRTYWNNQATGIVDDAVFELRMEPQNWGELIFKQQ